MEEKSLEMENPDFLLAKIAAEAYLVKNKGTIIERGHYLTCCPSNLYGGCGIIASIRNGEDGCDFSREEIRELTNLLPENQIHNGKLFVVIREFVSRLK